MMYELLQSYETIMPTHGMIEEVLAIDRARHGPTKVKGVYSTDGRAQPWTGRSYILTEGIGSCDSADHIVRRGCAVVIG